MKRTNNSNKSVHNISHSAASVTQMNLQAIIDNASHFEKRIEKKMSQFEKQGISVSTCTEHFDSMIDKYTAKLLSQLEKTHSDNANIIRQYLRRRTSEKIRLENLLRRLEEEIAATTLEYNALKILVDKADPLKSTMLQDEGQKKEDQNE